MHVDLDTTVLTFLISMREPIGILFFSIITHFADTLTVGVVLLVGSLYLLVNRKSRSYVIGLVSTVGGAKISEVLIKILVERARPADVALLQLDTYSFPSGHATTAMALYGFLAYVLWQLYPKWRLLIVTLSALLITGIGISRVYLGVHYPSDVIGGYLLGALWILLGAKIVRYWRN